MVIKGGGIMSYDDILRHRRGVAVVLFDTDKHKPHSVRIDINEEDGGDVIQITKSVQSNYKYTYSCGEEVTDENIDEHYKKAVEAYTEEKVGVPLLNVTYPNTPRKWQNVG
jgi:hypothetical protein